MKEIHQSILYKPVINIAGPPNSGKSTLASLLFSECKIKGCNCELVTEVAKDLVYEKSKYRIWNQPYVFGNQLARLIRVIEYIDFIITDSPIILSIVYTPECFSSLENLVKQCFSYFNNYSYILPLHKDFSEKGRKHTKKECILLSEKITNIVTENCKNTLILENHNTTENVEKIIEHAKLVNFFKK
mgnify:CR=1 FL=1